MYNSIKVQTRSQRYEEGESVKEGVKKAQGELCTNYT